MFCCSSSKTDSPRKAPKIDSDNLTEISKSPAHPEQHAAEVNNNLRTHLMKNEAGVTLALDAVISGIKNNEGGAKASIRKCKQLGKGGFGVVWLATTDNGRTQIALKELNEPFIFVPGSADSQEKLKQLPFAEAAIQTLLVQKNIVRTHWADVSIVDPDTQEPLGIRFKDVIAGSDGAPSSEGSTEWTQLDNIINQPAALNLPSRVGLNMRIVMEYCEYGSLFDYLRPRLPPELQAQFQHVVPLNIARGRSMEQTLCAMMTSLDIARGLKLLHRSRVVHGDLKPHNILLAADEEDPRGFVAKVSDFGLSRHLARGASSVGGVTHGTAAYMSPESLKDRAVTYRSDIFALGVIMWELWHNESWSSIYDSYKRQHNLNYMEMKDFKPRCHPTCPREYATIAEDCLASEPAARPKAQDVTHRLENCIFERRATMQL